MSQFLIFILLICTNITIFSQPKENLEIAGLETLNSLIRSINKISSIDADDKVVVLYAKTTFYIYEDRYIDQSYSIDNKVLKCQRGIREAQSTPITKDGVLYEGEQYKSLDSKITVLCAGELIARALVIRSEDFIDSNGVEYYENSSVEKVNLYPGQAYKFHMNTVICLPGSPANNQSSNKTFNLRKSRDYITNGSSNLKVLFQDETLKYHDETYFSGKKYAVATCCSR